ncbi:zinc metallopeptidase [Caproiciproducens galactitolivorans]|uniref:Putative neutral zinc metallopeptidase n=1 Tax=Caproiciproducens galactitolivorans TaxID=642589 RepID=A0A4Z0XYR0_9FIRM|nr:zinc metallopeptidase [Caproiciproducens galactitolivorans]QEY34035.1 zinc metallopeptidase [Caproiciproducens galactitolivorans]TGJ76554.1 putative neutral zinc metallopeptidase [Caproiciproducens galactitolivorans]
MGFYYFDYTYFIFILPALIITMYAQFKVQFTFEKYSRILTIRNMTGAQAADSVARFGGAAGVQIQRIQGRLTDNFDPRDNTIRLSDDVYSSTSIASVGVAAHEAGHAIQHAQGYFPNKVRTVLVPITNFGSSLGMPLVIIGLILPVRYSFVVYLGIALFGLAVLFQLVTLPVEFNASIRAIRALDEAGILYPDELEGAKKVLKAAAMTYLAASFAAIMSLLRLVVLAGNRRGRD